MIVREGICVDDCSENLNFGFKSFLCLVITIRFSCRAVAIIANNNVCNY